MDPNTSELPYRKLLLLCLPHQISLHYINGQLNYRSKLQRDSELAKLIMFNTPIKSICLPRNTVESNRYIPDLKNHNKTLNIHKLASMQE